MAKFGKILWYSSFNNNTVNLIITNMLIYAVSVRRKVRPIARD